jgi:hypothetical protein
MEELLLGTHLVVHGKITAHTDHQVTLKVKEILHNKGTGIKRGDYLRVHNDFSVVCPVEIPLSYAEQKKEGIFFLNYINETWHLTMGEAAFFNDNFAEIYFHEEGFVYRGTVEEWRQDLEGYYDHFHRNEDKKVIPHLPKDSWEKDAGLSPLALLQYKSVYRAIFKDLSWHPRLTRIEIKVPLEEKRYETLASVPGVSVPISPERMMEISSEIAAEARSRYPELEEKGIEGFTYYSLYIDSTGFIDKVTIDLVVHGRINDAIQDYYNKHPKLSPARDENGKAIHFRQRLQMRFQLSE